MGSVFRWLLLPALLILMVFWLFIGFNEENSVLLVRETSIEAFLERHWTDPIVPQGAVPSGFTELEASLAPQDCGSCHPRQWHDWRDSKHAQAMGIGILWQLPLLGQQEGNRCLRCHAPLAEQKALTAQRLGWSNAPQTPPPANVPEDLDLQGLVCAACHIRAQRFYGPPVREDAVEETQVHGGFLGHQAFEDSRFCAHCHQFPEDGPRVNGKLLEDTYAQWLAGPAAEQGTQCQGCHMPDRRHLWRGIHDPEMVHQALAVDMQLVTEEEDTLLLEVMLRNVGAGHLVPTYTVPKLVVEVNLLSEGATPKQIGRQLVGWYVETDLKTERYDTRIPPGQSQVLRFPLNLKELPVGAAIEMTLDVYPREHYERMFRQVLAEPALKKAQAEAVQKALDEALAARYRLLSRQLVPTGLKDAESSAQRIAN